MAGETLWKALVAWPDTSEHQKAPRRVSEEQGEETGAIVANQDNSREIHAKIKRRG